MQLKQLPVLLTLILGFNTYFTYAQPSSSKVPAPTSTKTTKTKATETDRLPIDYARKQTISLFNLFRDYSVTIDTILSTKADNREDNGGIKDASPAQFKNFLSKMDATLRRKLDVLPEGPNKLVEQEKLNKALSMLKSAECLANKDKGTFEITKDMDGTEIIAFPLDSLRKKSRYGLVDSYNEGYARIQKDQVFGFLNLCGDEAITCQYERVEQFNNGMALARRIDWFFIDTKGVESAPFENVIDAKPVGNGVSLLKFVNNTFALVNNEFGSTKVPMSSFYESIEPFLFKSNTKTDVFKVRNGKKYGVIGLDGKIKIDPNYDDISFSNESGICRISLGGRIGLVDANWKIQFPPSFTTISDFNEYGIADARNENGLILIKKEGLVKSKIYQSASAFNEFGVAVISDINKNYGVIDTNFRIIVEPRYASIGSFNDMGLAPACLLSNKCGFIRYDGSEQIKANYESVGSFNSYGLAVAKVNVTDYKGKKNEKVSAQIVIDAQGNTIIPVTDEAIERKFYYELSDTLHSYEYLVVYAYPENNRSDMQFHLIHKERNQLVTSTPYQSITALDNYGNFRVRKNNLWGMLDSTGKVLAKPQFAAIQRGSEAFYAVQSVGNKWGFINQKGKQQIPFEYDEIRNFRNGYAPASKGKNKWGLITRFNAKVVPCIFKSILDKGAKYEVTDVEGLIYIINDQGDCETNCPKFETIRSEANKAAMSAPVVKK